MVRKKIINVNKNQKNGFFLAFLIIFLSNIFIHKDHIIMESNFLKSNFTQN